VNSGRFIPNAVDLQRAASILNAGERIAILVGAGAIDAASEVLAVADVLGAGIAKALLGKSGFCRVSDAMLVGPPDESDNGWVIGGEPIGCLWAMREA
jgi:thiamine pyrophosphate-dependent acetolactate synthase large subunit-like protein